MAAIRLLSFGNNGLTPGKVAGTNDFSSVYGTKDDVNSLKKLCADIKTDFFVDYDTVFFSKSGGGFSVNSDCAKTAIFNNAEQYPIYPTRAQYEDEPFYVLSPTLLSKVIDKVKSKANKYGFSNLSFSSLGEVSYSDFSKDGFELKKGIKNTVKQFQSLKKEGFSIAVSGANGYAANVADILFDVTATNGNYDAFDVQIPFYQMVFSNLKPMYTSAVNIAENADELVLNAAASGMGLGYTFSDKYISQISPYGAGQRLLKLLSTKFFTGFSRNMKANKREICFQFINIICIIFYIIHISSLHLSRFLSSDPDCSEEPAGPLP